jgi:hypothetical protein
MPFDNWMTPPNIIEKCRLALGGTIDVDPASNYVAQEYIQAKQFFVHPDEYDGRALSDGLSIAWGSKDNPVSVFCNPPYSRGNINKFVYKGVKEYANGTVSRMIFLVNSATDTEWYHMLLDHSSAALLWRGRIKFWKIFDGKAHEKWEGEKSKSEGKGKIGNSPRFLSTLFYFGNNREGFRNTFESEGKVLFL